jgi:hypothetical protein
MFPTCISLIWECQARHQRRENHIREDSVLMKPETKDVSFFRYDNSFLSWIWWIVAQSVWWDVQHLIRFRNMSVRIGQWTLIATYRSVSLSSFQRSNVRLWDWAMVLDEILTLLVGWHWINTFSAWGRRFWKANRMNDTIQWFTRQHSVFPLRWPILRSSDSLNSKIFSLIIQSLNFRDFQSLTSLFFPFRTNQLILTHNSTPIPNSVDDFNNIFGQNSVFHAPS